MNDPFDLGKLDLRQILEYYLGKQNAEDMLKTIEAAIKEGKRGDELKKLIFQLLCQNNVMESDVYCIMSLVPVVVTRVVIPS